MSRKGEVSEENLKHSAGGSQGTGNCVLTGPMQGLVSHGEGHYTLINSQREMLRGRL